MDGQTDGRCALSVSLHLSGVRHGTDLLSILLSLLRLGIAQGDSVHPHRVWYQGAALGDVHLPVRAQI